jgi:hypothetical protein
MQIIIQGPDHKQARYFAEWLEDDGACAFRKDMAERGIQPDFRLEMTYLDKDKIILEQKKGLLQT